MIVLIADDVADNRELLCRLAELQGHEAIAVSNGLEVVEKARQHHPDIILMDNSMPGMSGCEAAALIRRDPRFSSTPIVAFTEYSESAEIDACFAAGCSDVVSKPLDISRVQQLLIQYAEQKCGKGSRQEAPN